MSRSVIRDDFARGSALTRTQAQRSDAGWVDSETFDFWTPENRFQQPGSAGLGVQLFLLVRLVPVVS